MKIKYFASALIRENKIYFLIFDHTGNSVDKWEKTSWRGRGCRDVLLHIIEELKIHAKNKIICKITLSIPGEVTQDGISQYCLPLGWGRVNLAKIWKENCTIPMEAVGRRNMILLGEVRKLISDSERKDVHAGVIILGENLETALLINGRFIRDQEGNYSDLGNLPVYLRSSRKELSLIRMKEEASYEGMEAKYKRLRESYRQVLYYVDETKDVTEIVRGVKNENPLAIKVTDEAAEAIIRGIECFTSVVALKYVFICGENSEVNDFLQERIRVLSKRYKLDSTIYFSIADTETETAGCIDFTLFL